MRYDQSFIEELKSRNDIVDVISAYCQLEKKGGSYWARCPLPGHLEKTPSFCVNQTGQFYKCFGCGRGGDVISFIEEVESLNYVEAVEFLARRAGMEIPESDAESEEKTRLAAQAKETRLKILKETALFYVDNIRSEKGKPYADYVLKRGFDKKVFNTFGLGASLDYRTLPKYLLRKGFSYKDMLAAGVVTYNEEKKEYYDFEAERLIVPIIDSYNNVIAFGGRVIVKTDFAKYKNTRETSIFVKNRTLYNINNLKKLKREKGVIPFVIMAEGYMDVIALYSAGFRNVVASMGTSLTQEQAKILLRYTDTVVISYDGDAAGQNATFRGLNILKNAGLIVKCVTLPDNLDPDEIIKQRGAAAYQKLLDDALPLIDYKLEFVRKKYDLRDVSSRRKFVDEALEVIRESDKQYEREELLKRLSAYSRFTFESLKRDLEGTDGTQPPARREEPVERRTETETPSGLVKAERFVLSAVASGKKYASAEDLSDLSFSSEQRRAIAGYFSGLFEEGKAICASTLYDVFGETYVDELYAVLNAVDEVREANAPTYYGDSVRLIRITAIEEENLELTNLLKAQNDVDVQKKITAQIQRNIKELIALKAKK